MPENNKKIANAGLRLLIMLKELFQRPLSARELLYFIEEQTDNVYRKEVINKYLNTLKILGINLEKNKNRYSIKRNIETIEYDKMDLSLILFIQKYTANLHHEHLKENILEALQLIEKSYSPRTLALLSSKKIRTYLPQAPVVIKDENIKKFEKYCAEKLKLEIVYKENPEAKEQSFKIAPVKLSYKNGIAFLTGYCYYSNSYKLFLLENIIDAKQTPQLSMINSTGAVTFKLTGRLAHSYVLKEGDIVIQHETDSIIVSNSIEDKDLLLKRLIRYYDACEILYPTVMREKMLNLINEMENLYA